MTTSSSKRKRRSPKYHKNGMTHYKRKGKDCQMQSNRQPDKKKEKEKKPVSPEQAEHYRVMAQLARFSAAFFRQLEGYTGWHEFARETKWTHQDLFRKKNFPVLDGPRGVSYYPDFFFSVGWLVPPRDLRVSRDGWEITLTWQIPSRVYSLSRPDDELLVGYFYDSRPDAPRVTVVTGTTRGECRAVISIPPFDFPPGEVMHVYPFFRRADLTGFSESRYACC